MKRIVHSHRNYLLILTILISTFLFSACQPTPKEPVIAKKDALEQSIDTLSEQQEAFDPPDTWQDEIIQPATGNKVIIDANVVCPAFESLDILHIRPKNSTQQEVDAVIDLFSPESTLYNGEYQETRSELEERIIETQQIMAMTQKERDEVYGGTDEDLQQQLDDLKKRYAAAPEEAIKTEVPSLLTTDKDGYEILETYVDNGGSDDILFYVSNSVGELSASALLQVRLRDESAGGTLLPYTGTPEEIAQALFNVIGIKGAQLYKSSQAFASNNSDKMNTRLFYETTYKGLPIRAVCSLIEETERQYVAAVWVPEDIYVDVSENGLTSLFWSGHAEFVETVKENVVMLPMEDVMSSFNTCIFLQPIWGYGQNKDETATPDTYYITSIELCMTAVPQKDLRNEYFLIPAWNFYGYKDYTVPEEFIGYSEEKLHDMGFPNPDDLTQCLMTLSAIDGTLLHR